MSLVLSLALGPSGEAEAALFVDMDFAAFSLCDTFFLEAILGLVSLDTRAGWGLFGSLSGLVCVLVNAVALEVEGPVSIPYGVGTDSRSCGADLVLFRDSSSSIFAASIKARRLFFFGFEREGDEGRDGGERDGGGEEGRDTEVVEVANLI